MKKLNKEQLDVAIEVGMVVALMSCEGRIDRLYKIINEEGDFGGICDTSYTMAWFASEFIDLHKDTNWEELHFNSEGKEQTNPSDIFLYRSEKYKKFGKYVSCWDEAAEDYAEWRIETFNYEEFAKINHNKYAKNPLLS
jgi:hypothetical protein